MNVAQRLRFQSLRSPMQIAIATPVEKYRAGSFLAGIDRKYSTTTFHDLENRSSSIAVGLRSMGIGPGKRIVLLVRFGEDFITLVFALLKTGASIVLIDPGMGRSNLIRCLEAANPDGFVAIPVAQAIRALLRHRFPNAKLNVTVGRTAGILPSPTLATLEKFSASDYKPVETNSLDPAAVIFTTGSTGPPKGVLYTHQTFNHQIDQLVSHYGIEPGGADLSGFPLFGLFNAVMGTTTIIPDMNPIRPALVDPPRLLDAIDQWQANQAFGSPALWTAVGKYCEGTQRRVPSLKLVLSAGAPVPPRVMKWMRSAMHQEGTFHTPYGATEALPIASIESRIVLNETAAMNARGAGTCVGHHFSGVRWKVVAIDDGPLASMSQCAELSRGEIGELMVCGPVVSTTYVTRSEQNAFHKVIDSDGSLWHRMGDVGYLDDLERFWYCGRKSHRVQTGTSTLYTDPCESIFNQHPSVYRSALVGIPAINPELQRPTMVIEPWEGSSQKKPLSPSVLKAQLRELAQSTPLTSEILDIHIYPKSLPTDIRHNSKIFREKLVPWVMQKS
ncbi:MAG: fatty acid CoA ligase family protein [Planctomycetota bacterium]|nr:fatty acid CoA ligase family protein [Planctomycetota bacterium]